VANWRLELTDEARLFFQGRPVPVRRRGLAVLALIALGFEPRRVRIAGMLWRHRHALNNLRVELHELRRLFPEWARGKDPLALPDGLEVSASAHPLLTNLQGISPALDAWIAGLGEGGVENVPSFQFPELIPPFALFVRRLPLTDDEQVVREVVKAVRAPLSRRPRDLGVLRAGSNFDARTVLQDPQRNWVIFLPPYGEDPVDMLELRARLPAERVRHLELAPLGWWEARDRVLGELPFTEAARVYLAAGGQPGHIAELLSLRPATGFGKRLPLPQRVRAVYQRESRFLSLDARIALERLSVHPGTLPNELLAPLGLDEVVEELERKRWLVYCSEGWAFRHEAGRRALSLGMGEGRRRLYHRRMAGIFDTIGNPFAAAYHAKEAGLPWEKPREGRGWARVVLDREGSPLPPVETPRGSEVLIEGFEVESGSLEVRGDRLAFVRTPADPANSRAVFETPEIPTLVRIRGQAYVWNALGVGLDGDAAPLFIQLGRRRIVLASVEGPRFADEEWVLPMGERFEHWVRLPAGRRVLIGSRAESAVIEVRLSFYRMGGQSGDVRVPAFGFDLAPTSGWLGQRSA